MSCDFFDPIVTVCAPSCCVCSYYRGCEKEKATVSVRSTGSSMVERGLPTNFSTSYDIKI